MKEEPKQEQPFVGKYRAKVKWDRHFGQKARTAFAAMGRLGRPAAGQIRCVTFQRVDSEEEASTPAGSNRVTLRLPADSSLFTVQQEVGKRFGWNEAAVLYQLDSHGWELPIASDAQMTNAFEEWELMSGPRMRFKYDALFTEVETLLTESDDPVSMLRGAGAARAKGAASQ